MVFLRPTSKEDEGVEVTVARLRLECFPYRDVTCHSILPIYTGSPSTFLQFPTYLLFIKGYVIALQHNSFIPRV